MADLQLVWRLATADRGLAVVSTTRRDGTIQSSLVNAGITADPRDRADVIGFVARGDAVKVAHLRRRPYANVVFRAGWEWVAVEGRTTLIGPDDPLPGFDPRNLPGLLRTVFVDAGGSHEDWDEYDRVMASERRAVVLLVPDRVTSNA
jgi:PPOX class probable F420-dependent enzyme